jgi:hypothetical protein
MRHSVWLVLVSGLVLSAFLAAGRACSEERQGIEYTIPPRDRMSVGIEVLIDGRPLPTVTYAGRTYLPVPRVGAEYALRVWNHGPRRIAAIVSVDGLSVINGKPASASSPGYLVEPSGSILIKGWRRNLETVAAFSFQDREQSYAALREYPENVGVIGLLAVEEQAPPRPWPLRPGLEKKDAAPSALRASGEVGGIGTGYGRDVDSPAYRVPFVRGSNQRVITLYYDTVAALRKAGVPVDGPSPFPGDSEFAPPPPGK